jgi:hypothetical protein
VRCVSHMGGRELSYKGGPCIVYMGMFVAFVCVLADHLHGGQPHPGWCSEIYSFTHG